MHTIAYTHVFTFFWLQKHMYKQLYMHFLCFIYLFSFKKSPRSQNACTIACMHVSFMFLASEMHCLYSGSVTIFYLIFCLTLHSHSTFSFSDFTYIISLIPGHESPIYDLFHLSLTHVHHFELLLGMTHRSL
jgi:hypothetical protein